MIGDVGQSRALVKQASVAVRGANLVVAPPRPVAVPLTLKAQRSAATLVRYFFLGAIFVLAGYGAHDPDIRKAVDYRLTMLVTPGVSSFGPTSVDSSAALQQLPSHALHLFVDGQKGPRADRFADALNAAGTDSIARRLKSASLNLHPGTETNPTQAASLAGASLFLTALTPAEEAVTALPPEMSTAAVSSSSGEWAGLLRNASLSPEQPKSLFGGLTEDEFRARELRCMATAIYFEARDEPTKGQIAVAQVVMNRIRSPFYPKTVCGVVYQGERNRHGCQFSFTCTGKRNAVKEKAEWATAVKLAKQVIAGEIWLNEVGYATHYHATYVHPQWRFELDRVTQIGAHIFYKMRPGTIRVALLSEGL